MENKKIVILNLPNKEQITRRYMCSYVSPESLMPPLELLSCAAIARLFPEMRIKFIDAIAEKISLAACLNILSEYQPDFLLSLTGFECFEEDMDVVRSIKQALPQSKYILFGHYATHFPEATLQHSLADYILLGEPELVFKSFLEKILRFASLQEIEGIAFFNQEKKLIKQGAAARISDPNQLPIPAYDLLPKGPFYYEPLLAKPYGMIQTMRGCPYQCNYCVKSYGTKTTQLSTERIIEEMKIWINLHGVKSIRFIDDTFTISKKRVIALCQAILDEKISVEWACLSRTDNIDDELLHWMEKAGCKRIYFGLESGSQRMLDIYKKNVDAKQALEALKLCGKYQIETAAFFMSGHPEETENDFFETINFAVNAHLDYASFNPLTPYPGTPIFEQLKAEIDFSIYPYKNQWKSTQVYELFDQRKSVFYKSFYLRPAYWWRSIPLFFHHFKSISSMAYGLLRYLIWDKQFVISGLKGAKDK